MPKMREVALEQLVNKQNVTMSKQADRIAKLESLVRDMYGYIESDYPPRIFEPFELRMRELGIEVDG